MLDHRDVTVMDEDLPESRVKREERFFSRTFWKLEIPCLIFGIIAVPATLTSEEARLVRAWNPVEVRVVEGHGDGEYLVAYGDTLFTAIVDDEDDELDPEDRLTLLIDPDHPEVHAKEEDAVGGVLFGMSVALLPIAYPVGRWLRRRRKRQVTSVAAPLDGI